MFDDLEDLLKSAKREAYSRRAAREKVISHKHIPLKQAELEWTIGKTVCLIHKAEDGTETALGIFVEHLRGSSRWLRPTAETLSFDHQEIVTGSWWLHPSIREIPVDTPHEVRAIRERFEMLIEEFVEENKLPRDPLLAVDDLDDEDDDWVDEEEDEDEDEDEDEE